MTDVDVVGLGVWSESFSNWEEFCHVLGGGSAETGRALKPQAIAPNERRRAPLSVKMAVEVMDQACRMAALEPATVATVFASALGDMQITEYMCRTLADAPQAISPTRFHNSVHNAATGYWSIATQSRCPSSAVSGYSNSVSIPGSRCSAGIQVGVRMESAFLCGHDSGSSRHVFIEHCIIAP